MKKIILASGSPRRKELLSLLIGNNFEVKTSAYEEDNTLAMSPKDLVLYHSLEKGRDVAKQLPEGVVIGADTVVVFDGQVLGKPRNEDEAREMLEKISGQVVDIISGIAVIDSAAKKELRDFEITIVKMKQMSGEEITAYIKTGEPMDKAGAFAVQDRGAVFIEKIDGCYFNAVGLPLFKLNNLLNSLGVSIFEYK
ncbi:MAG: Maf family nucleotide pyrophosphatase [Patescibacteria group bacterium]|mgnify:CR=1 FL=1